MWESEEAYNRFRNSRLRSAVEKVIGPAGMAEGPPPYEGLSVHHIIQGK